MSLPLARYTVIDLTRARAGPTCVRQLADMGAQVIQVESLTDLEGELGFSPEAIAQLRRDGVV